MPNERPEDSGAKPTGRSQLPTEYSPLIEMARHYIEAMQAAHSGSWKMGEATRFEVDLHAGEIRWFFNDKVVRAPAQLIGTWNPDDQSFLWGWDHPSAPAGSAVAAAAVRAHAEASGISELSTRKIACGFEECYPIAGTAALIGELQGIYRFDAGGPWAYIGFGGVTLSKR